MTTSHIKKQTKEKTVICICGMAGSGKSTVALRLAEHYGLKYRSGGDALKALAAEMGYRMTGEGWWETKEGMRFLEERLSNLAIDRKVDAKLLEWAEEGDIILDSRVLPWLLKTGFKIWLDASQKLRARRIAERDGLEPAEAMRFLKEKERKTKAIYEKLYGFNLGDDLEPFNFILDVNHLDRDEVFESLRTVIDNLALKKAQNTTKDLNPDYC
jgi:cytidylate kinase